MKSSTLHRSIVRSGLSKAAALTLLSAAPAFAVEIETSNPDVAIRWDNTLRYNVGVRTQSPDSANIATPVGSNSTAKFGRGDVITNRLDVLSELDYVYKKNFGFRVSAQMWADGAYDGKEKVATTSVYPNAHYTDYVDKWNRGPSGELMDAFLFGKLDLGGVETNVKAGRHNLYWGESLFSPIHGISYSQGPVDMRKALATPGIEAKELFKPLNQLSFTTQFSDTFTVGGQYLLDWKASPLADGGTYWGNYDWLTMGGGTSGPLAIPFIGTGHAPKKTNGDWGLMSRWSPSEVGGTMGFYYREYTDKFPASIALAKDYSNWGLDYQDKRVKLVGVSFAKSIAGIAMSTDLVHRQGTPLAFNFGTTNYGNNPTGDTWHALFNVVGYSGKTPIFDSMVWMGEFVYSSVDKVRTNAANFNHVDYACKGGTEAQRLTCATNDFMSISARVEPKWMQVWNGVDVTLPIYYTMGVKGNSAVFYGGYEGNGSFSVGLTADYQNKHNFALTFSQPLDKKVITGNTVLGATSNLWDRGNLAFTYKTTF